MVWRTRRTRVWPSGFTLVELLVVIVIIVLLVGILAPSIMSAIKLSYATRSQVRVTELAGGAQKYFIESGNRYYPGQEDSSWQGTYTGSQVLAAELFQYDYSEIPGEPDPETLYSSCKVDRTNPANSDLFDPQQVSGKYSDGNRPNSLSDRFGAKPMALLYFSSRKGQSGLSQFEEDDNEAYLVNDGTSGDTFDGWSGGSFGDFIKNESLGNDTPYGSGQFLLIAPGMDRKYGTSDDRKNW